MTLYYLLLGLDALLSWLSMGFLSMLSLVFLFFALSHKADDTALIKAHVRWIKNTVTLAVLLHSSLLALEIYEFYELIGHFEDGFIRFLASHWLSDYLAEVGIAILLSYRGIKGGLRFTESLSPYHSG